MEKPNNGEAPVVTPTTPPEEKKVETPIVPPTEGTPAPSQNPIKDHLEKVKQPKTEAEKLTHSLQGIVKRAKEIGVDPFEILGVKPPEAPVEKKDDEPATIGDLKKIQTVPAPVVKSAQELADEQVTDADELELTKHYLDNNIKSSGNPVEDLKLARSLVNAVKNGQIIEEVQRATPPRTVSTGAGAPAKIEPIFEPTANEAVFMQPPYNMTKEEVIKARPKS